jgi:hypothetical protein
MLLGQVADQLLDDHGLADAGAAEQPDLAALGVRGEQVDHLDPGLEHLGRRRQVLDGRRDAVDRPALDVVGERRPEIDRVAEQVEDPAERDVPDRHRDRRAAVDHLDAAGQTVGGVHRDRADAVVAEVLLHLADEPGVLLGRDVERLLLERDLGAADEDRVVDLGQLVGEHGLDHDALNFLDTPSVLLVGLAL